MKSKYALKKFLCKSFSVNTETNPTLPGRLPEIDLPLDVHGTFSLRGETGSLSDSLQESEKST